jgi:hypothetical protein
VPERLARHIAQDEAPAVAEAHLPVRQPLDRVAALVQEPMVPPAQQDEVVHRRLAAAPPVADVVGVEEAPVLAARKPAAPIAHA